MEPSSSEIVWAFDLGKASIGEAVRQGNDFPHAESLLIPADLARRGPAAVSGTPASRYRAMKTREAHHKREEWLESVWRAAGLRPLKTRKPEYMDYHLRRKRKKTHGKVRWRNVKVGGQWRLPDENKADYRLEREFAPRQFDRKDGWLVEVKYPTGKAVDGAPAATQEDFQICYTSCLLRIKLLEWKEGKPKLEEWQIYKALRAALQHRGYGRVPWAAREPGRKVTKEEEAKEREIGERWERFKKGFKQDEDPTGDPNRSPVTAEFQLPCYYDAFQMNLWNPAEPSKLLPRSDHRAGSTRNVRFDRAAVREELTRLGNQAAAVLPELRDAFARWQREGWRSQHPVNSGKQLTYPVRARSFGELLCDGPAGQPDETSFAAFLNQRRKAGVRRGTFEEWMAALGQKTPSLDNRILNNCVLITRYHVCKVDVRLETDDNGKPTGRLVGESLLASEVTLLLKLKNLLVADTTAGQRKLTVEEVRSAFHFAQRRLRRLTLLTAEGELVKEWPNKVTGRFGINKSDWHSIAAESEFLARLSGLTLTGEGAARPLSTEQAELLLRAVATSKKSPPT